MMKMDLGLDLPKIPVCRFKRVVRLMATGQRSKVIQRVETVSLDTVFAEAWELDALYKSIEIREKLDDAHPEPIVAVRLLVVGAHDILHFYDLETGHHKSVASYLLGDTEIVLLVRTEYLLPIRDYLIVGTRLFRRDDFTKLKPITELDHEDVILLKELGVENQAPFQFHFSSAWSAAHKWVSRRTNVDELVS